MENQVNYTEQTFKNNILLQLDELSILESNHFKSRAYKNAYYSLLNVPDAELRNCADFTCYPSIGTGINKKILEFRATGKISKIEELRVTNKDYLDGKLYKIRKSFITKRIPLKKAEGQLRSINNMLKNLGYPTMYYGDDVYNPNHTILVAGSMRRQAQLIADIDCIVLSDLEMDNISEGLMKIGCEAIVWGDTKRSFKINNEAKTTIDLNYINGDLRSLPFQLLHHTGSMGNNIRMRSTAKERGLTLNQYGLYNSDGELIPEIVALTTEREVYEFLGLDYLEPEQR